MQSPRFLLLAALALTVVSVSAGQNRLVVCAPGYPGDTEQAQPTMDALALALERAGAVDEGSLEAVYHPAADAGLASLAEARTTLALVPLPFYLRYADEAALEPILEVVHAPDGDEVWALVAATGTVSGPADLGDRRTLGTVGYAPDFVRRVAFADWGPFPAGAEVAFAPRVLSVLRRAARGEAVVAVLDRVQTDALSSLPFGGQLEVVVRSPPMVGALVCRVRDRIDEAGTRRISTAFLALHAQPDQVELLDQMGIREFRQLDASRLAGWVRLYGAGKSAP